MSPAAGRGCSAGRPAMSSCRSGWLDRLAWTRASRPAGRSHPTAGSRTPGRGARTTARTARSRPRWAVARRSRLWPDRRAHPGPGPADGAAWFHRFSLSCLPQLVAVGKVDRRSQPDRDRLALMLRKGRGNVDLRLQDLFGQIVGAVGRDVGVAALRHRRLHDAEAALGQAQDDRAAKALKVVIVDRPVETATPEIVRHRDASERDP